MKFIHLTRFCNCGRTGCLETIASATGIVRQAMELMAEFPESNLASYYNRNGNIDTEAIFYMAKTGDKSCKQIIDRTADVLGYALASAATLINPSKIIIGGGVSNAREQLLEPVTNAFRKHSLPRISEVCEIKIAELGNDAGIIGAAYLVKKNII